MDIVKLCWTPRLTVMGWYFTALVLLHMVPDSVNKVDASAGTVPTIPRYHPRRKDFGSNALGAPCPIATLLY
jgi:hypothetical protein